MKIKNLKTYFSKKMSSTKFVLVAVSLAVGLSITGCQTESKVEGNITIDADKVNTNQTTVKERYEYYEKYVDDIINDANQEEKIGLLAHVNLEFLNAEAYSDDSLVFLRNDDVYKGDVDIRDKDILLPPGVYRIVSKDIMENNGILGEFDILSSKEEINISIDYATKSIQVKDEAAKTR